MDCISLSALGIGYLNQCIRVRASRVCHHRGGLEDGDIKEIRIVFVDEKGDSIYAIVPRKIVDQNIHVIHENAVYELALFEVSDQRRVMNPVANPLVIVFTELTIVQLVLNPDDMFPEWTYRLTPIADLPQPSDTPRRSIDVIGVIRGISDIATVDMPGRNVLATRRHIVIDDGDGNEVRLTLWGEGAIRFNGQVIRFLGREESAVAIFVAVTVSMNEGSKEIAGASACRWYINEDIQEINILRAKVQSSFRPISKLRTPRQIHLHAPVNDIYPLRPLSVLVNSDLFQNQDSMFRCIVTIWRPTPGQRWWITRCADCRRIAKPVASSTSEPNKYRCSNVQCTCTKANLEYRLYLLGSDITGEAEFTLIGNIAQTIITVSPQQVVLNNYTGDVPITNLAIAAAQICHTPPEIAAIASWMYKFVVYVTASSFKRGWARFSVHAIEAAYPPE